MANMAATVRQAQEELFAEVQDILGTEVCTLRKYLGHDVNWAQR